MCIFSSWISQYAGEDNNFSVVQSTHRIALMGSWLLCLQGARLTDCIVRVARSVSPPLLIFLFGKRWGKCATPGLSILESEFRENQMVEKGCRMSHVQLTPTSCGIRCSRSKLRNEDMQKKTFFFSTLKKVGGFLNSISSQVKNPQSS